MDALALVQSLAGERARFVRLARRHVETEADAEDVVQRALARAAERAASLGDPSLARAWFYRILRNTITDHHRAAPGDPLRRADAQTDDLVDEAVVEPTTPCRCGTRLLEGLRPGYAEIIRRVDLEGEDPASVAADLGISRGNLDVRLHRARAKLKGSVQGYCGVQSHRPCLDCMCDGEHRCGGPSAVLPSS
jgi:RNA polymerase sigma factor (sigma-70 family)